MKNLAILIVTLCSFQIAYCQPDEENHNSRIEHQGGFDLGLGVNSFQGEHDNYTKGAIDLGFLYEYNERFIIGLDFSFAPKDQHEDTGIDGSRSTHVEWDVSATCIEMYLGYKAFRRTSILLGMGTCYVTEYDVMMGYSNLTSYKSGNLNLFAPMIGAMYEFPIAFSNSWYLKYDMAIGDYDRFSISAGIKF
ncbi:hypothetical protein [Carboxylicivirga caseinilyticus]|uniref:hypothetical protein n=1 Tax=Carboxylicivirga caseinilyticus TaxID=3417572 RepID=UPI003D32ED71|nr:outer membrane beta-barrel protein [Marinilabiliaceae bacterium A049]